MIADACDQLLTVNRLMIRAGKHLGPQGQWLGRNRRQGLSRGVTCPYCGADEWGGYQDRQCKQCQRAYAFARNHDRPLPPIGYCTQRQDARTGAEVRAGKPLARRVRERELRRRELQNKRDAYGAVFGSAALEQASNQRIAAWYHAHFSPR